MVPALAGAAAAAAIVLVAVRLATLTPQPTAFPGVQPTPTATASPLDRATASPEATVSPAPSTTDDPTVSPEPTNSPSAEPFPDGNRCHNDRDGYSVNYPAGWYTNPAVAGGGGLKGLPTCLSFSREPIELLPHTDYVPPSQAVGIYRYPEESPHFGEVLVDEQRTVHGRIARVIEYRIPDDFEGFEVPGSLIYRYTITLDDGDVLEVRTDTVRGEDYPEQKRIMDLMMRSLRWDRPEPSASPSPASADPLPDGTECHNDRYGFTVRYPRGWHTNPAVPSQDGSEYIATCTAFGREPLELIPHTGYVPPSQAVRFSDVPRRPSPADSEILIDEERIVDGRTAQVSEYRILDDHGAPDSLPTGTSVYHYVITVDTDRVLRASTDSYYGEDYPEQKRILDLMMQTLVLDP
jgi:hypothetical protein